MAPPVEGDDPPPFHTYTQPYTSLDIYCCLSVPIPTYILGPTEKEEVNYFASVSLDSGGEMCENVTYLGNNVDTVSSTARTTCYGLLMAKLCHIQFMKKVVQD